MDRVADILKKNLNFVTNKEDNSQKSFFDTFCEIMSSEERGYPVYF